MWFRRPALSALVSTSTLTGQPVKVIHPWLRTIWPVLILQVAKISIRRQRFVPSPSQKVCFQRFRHTEMSSNAAVPPLGVVAAGDWKPD